MRAMNMIITFASERIIIIIIDINYNIRRKDFSPALNSDQNRHTRIRLVLLYMMCLDARWRLVLANSSLFRSFALFALSDW